MLIVAGHARFGSEEEIDKVFAAGTTMIAETLKEEGCIDYSFARSIADPLVMRIFEKWVDQAALDSHFQMPHMAEFNKVLGQVSIAEVSVNVYEIGAERKLM